jgi:hypothetical protein
MKGYIAGRRDRGRTVVADGLAVVAVDKFIQLSRQLKLQLTAETRAREEGQAEPELLASA